MFLSPPSCGWSIPRDLEARIIESDGSRTSPAQENGRYAFKPGEKQELLLLLLGSSHMFVVPVLVWRNACEFLEHLGEVALVVENKAAKVIGSYK
jgi:hypothetical protein